MDYKSVPNHSKQFLLPFYKFKFLIFYQSQLGIWLSTYQQKNCTYLLGCNQSIFYTHTSTTRNSSIQIFQFTKLHATIAIHINAPILSDSTAYEQMGLLNRICLWNPFIIMEVQGQVECQYPLFTIVHHNWSSCGWMEAQTTNNYNNRGQQGAKRRVSLVHHCNIL